MPTRFLYEPALRSVSKHLLDRAVTGAGTFTEAKPKMTTIPNKTLPRGIRSERPTLPHDERNSAQALRPTFDGWGPRL